jgi:hypothetical protein
VNQQQHWDALVGHKVILPVFGEGQEGSSVHTFVMCRVGIPERLDAMFKVVMHPQAMKSNIKMMINDCATSA